MSIERFTTSRSKETRSAIKHDVLKNCSFFNGRDSKFLARVVEHLDVEMYKQGDIIIQEGDVGETTYVLHQGEVEVLVGPTRECVATLSSGSIFGEMTLLGVSDKRTSTIRALEFCDCRVIHHRAFVQILNHFPREKCYFDQLAEKCRAHLEKDAPLCARHRSLGSARPSTGGGLNLRAMGIVTNVAVRARRASKLNHGVGMRRGSNDATMFSKLPDDDCSDCSDATQSKSPASARPHKSTFLTACLEKCAFFNGRDPRFIEVCMSEFTCEVFNREDIIVNEGDSGATMYYLHGGEAEVLVGPECECVATLSVGAIFGELAVLGVSDVRTTTVRASTFCDCRVLSKEAFNRLLDQFPEEKDFFTQLAKDRMRALTVVKRRMSGEVDPVELVSPKVVATCESFEAAENFDGLSDSSDSSSDKYPTDANAPSSELTLAFVQKLLSPAPSQGCVNHLGSRAEARRPPSRSLGAKARGCLLPRYRAPLPELPPRVRRGNGESSPMQEPRRLAWHQNCPAEPVEPLQSLQPVQPVNHMVYMRHVKPAKHVTHGRHPFLLQLRTLR